MKRSIFGRPSRVLAGALCGLAVVYAACADYIEPPLPEKADPVIAVLEEDAAPLHLATPEAGGEPVRDGGGKLPPDPSEADAGPAPPIPPPLTGGHVYYTFDQHVWRIAAAAGARPENISTALDKFGTPGNDVRLTSSNDSRWMLLTSARFGCGFTACLVLVPSDLSRVEVVRPGGKVFEPQGVAAIKAVTGDLIVYPATGGPHLVDLFATRRRGGGWAAPVLLTAASTYPYNNMPALTFDGTKVTFDCGQNPSPETGNNDACEVNVDGTGYRRILGTNALPNSRQTYVQNPHVGLDGLLFEAAWQVDSGDPEVVLRPEIIWRLPNDGGRPVPNQVFDNAVSPCTLPDGRYAMLWLGGPGNDMGDHELAVANRAATSAIVLTPGVDVTDIGIGCGD